MKEIVQGLDQKLKPFRNMLLFLLFALVFAIQVLQIDFPMELMLAIVALIALSSNRTQLLGLTLCFIPLFGMIQYLYALAICMVIFVVKFSTELRWNHVVPILAAMLAWEILHYDFSLGVAVSSARVIAPLVFCGFLMMIDGKRFDYPRLARGLAVSVVVVSIILWFRCASIFGQGVIGYILKGNRLGLVYHSVENIVVINPNTWGFICLMAITGLLQLLVSSKGSACDILVLCCLLVFGFLTQSKTFILCLAVAAVMFLYILCSDRKTFALGVSILAGMALAGLLLGWLLLPSIVEPLLERLVASDSNNLRMKIFWEYTTYLFSDLRGLFFGLGAWDLKPRIIERFTDVPHNAIQEIIVVWGILGLVFFGLFIYNYLITSRKNNKQKLINYIPLVLLLIKIQLGQFVTAGHTLLLLSFVYMSLCYDFGEPKKIHRSGKWIQ